MIMIMMYLMMYFSSDLLFRNGLSTRRNCVFAVGWKQICFSMQRWHVRWWKWQRPFKINLQVVLNLYNYYIISFSFQLKLILNLRSCTFRDRLGPNLLNDMTWVTKCPANPLAIGQYVNNSTDGINEGHLLYTDNKINILLRFQNIWLTFVTKK